MWKLEEIKRFFQLFFLKLEDERERKNGARERQSRRKNKRGQHRDELRKIFFGTVAREHLFVVFIKYQITVTVLLQYIKGTHTICDIQYITVILCHSDSFTKQSMVFHR